MHVTYMELPNFMLHQNHTLLLKKILKISKLLMSDLELNEDPANGCIKGGEQSVPWLDVCKICAIIKQIHFKEAYKQSLLK